MLDDNVAVSISRWGDCIESQDERIWYRYALVGKCTTNLCSRYPATRLVKDGYVLMDVFILRHEWSMRFSSVMLLPYLFYRVIGLANIGMTDGSARAFHLV